MIFEVKDANFSYGKRKILENINFSVTDTDVLAVLGPNGVGKTTLLKCMMGLNHWSSGASYLDGNDIKTLSHGDFWSRVAYVPQAKNLTFGYKALDMVVLGIGAKIGIFGCPSDEDYEKAQSCLEAIGVGHLSDKSCTAISGGELQMVLIARALMSEPELLVMDEPETGLDFKNQLIVLSTIKNTLQERGIATVINTHYPEHALEIANKALLLHRDRRNVFGKVDEILTPSNLGEVFQVEVEMGQFEYKGQEHKYVVPVDVI